MMTSRRRAPLLLLVAAVMAAMTASCSPAVASRALARRDCQAVGLMLGAPPADQAVMTRRVLAAPRSGEAGLDASMLLLKAALRSGSAARANRDSAQVRNDCAALGLWQVYH